MRNLLLAWLALSLPAVAAAAPASVLLRAELSPTEIHVGDPLDLRITVVYSTAIASVPTTFPTTLGEFEVLSTQVSQPEADKDGRQTIVHRLSLTTFSTGTLTVPSVAVHFKNTDGTLVEARTEPLPVTVKSLLAEKGDEGGLRPLKGLFNVRSFWWLWALLGLAGAGLLGWLIYRWRQKGVGGILSGPPEPTISPEEEAMRALAELEASAPETDQKIKEFYFRLSEILRHYIDRRYDVSALEMTTSELMAAFRRLEIGTEASYVCRGFLDNADLVKFAKLTPTPEDIAGDVARVKEFIRATTPVPVAPADEERAPV